MTNCVGGHDRATIISIIATISLMFRDTVGFPNFDDLPPGAAICSTQIAKGPDDETRLWIFFQIQYPIIRFSLNISQNLSMHSVAEDEYSQILTYKTSKEAPPQLDVIFDCDSVDTSHSAGSQGGSLWPVYKLEWRVYS